MSPEQTRTIALQHLNCKVSLDVYSDNSVCLICEDHDVVITNFGSCCLRDVMRPASPSDEECFAVIDSLDDPKFIEMEELDDAEPDCAYQGS